MVIEITKPELLTENAADIITTEKLGFGYHSEQLFEQADGSPYYIDKDFFGTPRGNSAIPGPFHVTDKEKYEFSFE